jgi:two-component system, chemotaxis family, chemotaxis protein CheY
MGAANSSRRARRAKAATPATTSAAATARRNRAPIARSLLGAELPAPEERAAGVAGGLSAIRLGYDRVSELVRCSSPAGKTTSSPLSRTSFRPGADHYRAMVHARDRAMDATTFFAPETCVKAERTSWVSTMRVASGRELVLVVDDDLDFMTDLTRYLGDIGFDVAQASDGIDAISYLHANRPDVVLVDLVMPRMNGLEFIEQVRSDSSLSGLLVVAMSGTPKMLDLARRAGAHEVMRKPIDPVRLARSLVQRCSACSSPRDRDELASSGPSGHAEER